MSLTVLSVSYSLARVGPDAIGGAEQVLTQLDRNLVRGGHRSIVVAPEGSKTYGTLIPTPWPDGTFDDLTRRTAIENHKKAIEHALEHWDIDVVHLHGIDFLQYLPRPGVPVLCTLHLPLSWYPQQIFNLERPRTFLNCVSAAQKRGFNGKADAFRVVENGVPEELFAHPRQKGSFAVSLGRICPEKGFHMGLKAAALAGIPLLLAGEVFRYSSHEKYFREEIVPRLDRRRRFIGPVGARRKRGLLGAAHCLVVPSLVPETSSLVAMEALACGTPVVAFPVGALTDIVEHGSTGFLVKDVSEMARAIREASSLAPDLCRKVAVHRFSEKRMYENYLGVYRQLSAKEPLVDARGLAGCSPAHFRAELDV